MILLIGSRCIDRGVVIEGISDRWLFATVPENVRRIRFNRSRIVGTKVLYPAWSPPEPLEASRTSKASKTKF